MVEYKKRWKTIKERNLLMNQPKERQYGRLTIPSKKK